MTIAIMQPYIFPYIGYWQLLQASDVFVIFDDVNYIKKGYINRNAILIDGQAKRFTIELIGASQNKLINEIDISGNNAKLLRSISMAYKKAPYFDIVYPLVEEILLDDERNLAKYIGNSLKKIANYLEINNNIVYSSDIEKDNTLKAQDKILDISRRLNATHYVNAIGGQDLYDKEVFIENNIQLNFIQTDIIEYKQFKNDFVPYLSIIDILMFNSVEQIDKMLESYELV